MQIDPIFLFGVGTIGHFIIRFLVLSLAIYFAGRIMAGQVITMRDAFIGALIVVIVQEVAWWIIFFILPSFADIIGILVALIVLILAIIKFYDFGVFGAIALVMLAVVMFSAVRVATVALYYILFVPLP